MMSARSGRLGHPYLWLVAIVAGGLLLRAWPIGSPSLWQDEAASWGFAVQPASAILTTVFHTETNPPLFYLLLHYVLELFGQSEAAMRLLPVLASAGTIVVAYAIGAVLLTPAAGLFAALFMALTPAALFYAQEARAYALVSLLFALEVLGVLLATRGPAGRGRLAGWGLFAAAATANLYTHYTSVLFLAVCVGCTGVWLVARRFRAAGALLGATGVVAVLGAPALMQMLRLGASPLVAWIGPPRLIDAETVTLKMLGYAYLDPAWPWLDVLRVAAPLAGLGLLLARRSAAATGYALVAAMLFGDLALLYGASHWLHPVMLERTVFPLTALAAVLLGVLVAGIPRSGWRCVAAAVLLLPGLAACLQFLHTRAGEDDYPAVVAFLATHVRPQDLVIAGPGIAYYRQRVGAEFPLQMVYQGMPAMDLPGLANYPHPQVDLGNRATQTLYVVATPLHYRELFAPGGLESASELRRFGREMVFIFR